MEALLLKYITDDYLDSDENCIKFIDTALKLCQERGIEYIDKKLNTFYSNYPYFYDHFDITYTYNKSINNIMYILLNSNLLDNEVLDPIVQYDYYQELKDEVESGKYIELGDDLVNILE